MAKRRLDDEPPGSGAKCQSGIFSRLTFFLHPAALSPVRRGIFERQIPAQGGVLSAEPTEPQVLVMIEDHGIPRDRWLQIARDCRRKWAPPRARFVKMSWLSQCLAQQLRLPLDHFEFLEPEHRGPAASPPLPASAQGQVRGPIDTSKFVCAQSSAPKSGANPNQVITDELEKLAAAYKNSNDTWRAFGYQKAIAAIKKHPQAITCGAEAAQLPNVGRKMADKIAEILEDGSLRKVAEICDNEKMHTLDLFNRVWGAGPKTAEQWFQRGWRTLEDLAQDEHLTRQQKVGLRLFHDLDERMSRDECTTIFGVVQRAALEINPSPKTAEQWFQRGWRTLEDLAQDEHLTRQQKVGLRLFHDLDERMSRDECTTIFGVVQRAALEINPSLELVACGSYRRGKSTCGDLDILITHPRLDDDLEIGSLFESLLAKLHQSGFLTDDLSVMGNGRQRKYLGVCQLPGAGSKHRRLDIIVVPRDERATALMYFTGSAHFNRSMRLLASKMGMSLSEHALVTNVARVHREKVNEGTALATPTEESVFEHLKLPYRTPEERNH
eukprot:maker-scaffold671_size114370-snap-gene-0.35 protein:Tk06026 transcript:maker-scaffold671_size114370-snap-gene-0.35-mRNA-1 annotation:"dna polymerase lambda-like"